MSEIATIRLPKAQAEFLQANIATMLERTREAVGMGGPDERRRALGKRIVMLAVISDAVKGALITASIEGDRLPQGRAPVETLWEAQSHQTYRSRSEASAPSAAELTS